MRRVALAIVALMFVSTVVQARVSNLLESLRQPSLILRDHESREWAPSNAVLSSAGTVLLKVKPLWPANDKQSHTLFSFRWAGADQGYAVLSYGWAPGPRKLSFILNDREAAVCAMPWDYDPAILVPNQSTQLAVTWSAGNPGSVSVFVDGQIICKTLRPMRGDRVAGPLVLGSDQAAAADSRNRPSDFAIEDLQLLDREMTDREVWTQYLRAGGDQTSKWITALVPAPAPAGKSESRIMFDEDSHWSDSKGEIDKRVRRMKQAGFNVYSPIVWWGAGAVLYRTPLAPLDPRARNVTVPDYDPLAYLLQVAHREGIEVHPWFIVSRHAEGDFPPEFTKGMFPAEFTAGMPPGVFNLHNLAFRDFIVRLMIDAMQRYDVDGINLDYIRVGGLCADESCNADYRKQYNRSLAADWDAFEHGANVPTLIEWNRIAVTDIVRRVAEGRNSYRPRAVISIDTIPLDGGRWHQGVDEAGWIQKKYIDLVCFMAYEDILNVAHIDLAAQKFAPQQLAIVTTNYKAMETGSVMPRAGVALVERANLIRTRWPGRGIAYYHYMWMDDDQVGRLRSQAFGSAAIPTWRGGGKQPLPPSNVSMRDKD